MEELDFLVALLLRKSWSCFLYGKIIKEGGLFLMGTIKEN
jgi:hypothetical protein